jgi:hypothetical protein
MRGRAKRAGENKMISCQHRILQGGGFLRPGLAKGRGGENMPVIVTPVDSSLQIIVQTGVDANNKPVYRTRSYNRVKTDAQDQDVLDVAKQIIGLQAHPVNSIRRVMETELNEQV